jgi:hypothetical protein
MLWTQNNIWCRYCYDQHPLIPHVLCIFVTLQYEKGNIVNGVAPPPPPHTHTHTITHTQTESELALWHSIKPAVMLYPHHFQCLFQGIKLWKVGVPYGGITFVLILMQISHLFQSLFHWHRPHTADNIENLSFHKRMKCSVTSCAPVFYIAIICMPLY